MARVLQRLQGMMKTQKKSNKDRCLKSPRSSKASNRLLLRSRSLLAKVSTEGLRALLALSLVVSSIPYRGLAYAEQIQNSQAFEPTPLDLQTTDQAEVSAISRAELKELSDLLKRAGDRSRLRGETPNLAELQEIQAKLLGWKSKFHPIMKLAFAKQTTTNPFQAQINLRAFGDNLENSFDSEDQVEQLFSFLRSASPLAGVFGEISKYFEFAYQLEELFYLTSDSGRGPGFADKWREIYGLSFEVAELVPEQSFVTEATIFAELAQIGARSNLFETVALFAEGRIEMSLSALLEASAIEKRTLFLKRQDPIAIVQEIATGYLVKNLSQVRALLYGQSNLDDLGLSDARQDLKTFNDQVQKVFSGASVLSSQFFIERNEKDFDESKLQLKPSVLQQLQSYIEQIPDSLADAVLQTRQHFASQEVRIKLAEPAFRDATAPSQTWRQLLQERLEREAPVLVSRFLSLKSASQDQDPAQLEAEYNQAFNLVAEEIFLRQLRDQLRWVTLQTIDGLNELNNMPEPQLLELNAKNRQAQADIYAHLFQLLETGLSEIVDTNNRTYLWHRLFEAQNNFVQASVAGPSTSTNLSQIRTNYITNLIAWKKSIGDVTNPENPHVDFGILRHSLYEEFYKNRFSRFGFQQNSFSPTIDTMLWRAGQEESTLDSLITFRGEVLSVLGEGFRDVAAPPHWQSLADMCAASLDLCDYSYAQMLLDLSRSLFNFEMPVPSLREGIMIEPSAPQISMTMKNSEFFRHIDLKNTGRLSSNLRLRHQEDVSALQQLSRTAKELLFQMLVMGYWSGLIGTDSPVSEDKSTPVLKLDQLAHITDSIKQDYKKRLNWATRYRLPIMGIEINPFANEATATFGNATAMAADIRRIEALTKRTTKAPLLNWLSEAKSDSENWQLIELALQKTEQNILKSLETIKSPYKKDQKPEGAIEVWADAVGGWFSSPPPDEPTQDFLMAVGQSLHLQNEMAQSSPEAFRRLHESLDYNPLRSQARISSDATMLFTTGPVLAFSLGLLVASLGRQFLGTTAIGRVSNFFLKVIDSSGGVSAWVGRAIMLGFGLLLGKTGYDLYKESQVLQDLARWNQTNSCSQAEGCDLWIDDEAMMLQHSRVSFLQYIFALNIAMLAASGAAFWLFQSGVGPTALYRLRFEMLIARNRYLMNQAGIRSVKDLARFDNRDALEMALLSLAKAPAPSSLIRRRNQFSQQQHTTQIHRQTERFLKELDSIGRFSDQMLKYRSHLDLQTLTGGKGWPKDVPLTEQGLNYHYLKWFNLEKRGVINSLKMAEINAAYNSAYHLVSIRSKVIPSDLLTRFPVYSSREAMQASLRRAGVDVVDIQAQTPGSSSPSGTGVSTSNGARGQPGYGRANQRTSRDDQAIREGDEFITPQWSPSTNAGATGSGRPEGNGQWSPLSPRPEAQGQTPPRPQLPRPRQGGSN